MKVRFALAFVLILASVMAGCGGQDKPGTATAGGPRGEALSYYPADTPFVLLAATDPQGAQIKQALALVRRFAPGGLILDQLKSRLSSQVDFDREVKPLLGNPIALGAPDATSFGGSNRNFLFAWMVKDAGKLQPLVDRLVRTGGAHPAPDHLGAKVYSSGDGSTLAVRGALVLFGKTPAIVTAALDRRSGSGHLDPAAVDAARGDLPPDALLTGYGHLAALLARPSAAKAMKVPWVAALRSYAFAVSSDGQGVHVDFRLDTTKHPLGAADVPVAPGATAPSVSAGAPVRAGIRDFAHVVTWVERAQTLAGGASRPASRRRRPRSARRPGSTSTATSSRSSAATRAWRSRAPSASSAPRCATRRPWRRRCAGSAPPGRLPGRLGCGRHHPPGTQRLHARAQARGDRRGLRARGP